MTTPATATNSSLPAQSETRGSPVENDRHIDWRYAAGLFAIVLGAAALRCVGLGSQGLVYWDEAKFALEGVRFHSELLSFLTGSHLELAGKAVGTAKPSHALLIGVAYLVAGVHDYVPPYLNAAASLIGVVFVYLLGRRLFGLRAGLIASALLAVTMYDVVYARSALSESDGNAVLLGGLLIWAYTRRVAVDGQETPDRTPLIALAGLALGFALTINYRIAPSIAAIVVFDLMWTAIFRWRVALPRLACWLAGVAVAPMVWQIAGNAMAARGIVLFRNESTLKPETYLGQLLGRFQVGLGTGPSAGSFQWSTVLERLGPVMVALLVLALIFALRARSSPWILIVLLVAVPLAGSLSASFSVARSLSVAIPFAALAAAATLDVMARGSATGGRIAWAVAALAVLVGATTSWGLMGERSGFARAVAYVKARGSDRTLTSSEVPVFYFSGPGAGCRAPRPTSLDALVADVQGEYSYVILDYHSHGFMERILRDHGKLVARYPMLTGSGPLADLVASEDAQHPVVMQTDNVDVIRIEHLRSAAAGRVPPDTCVPDRPG